MSHQSQRRQPTLLVHLQTQFARVDPGGGAAKRRHLMLRPARQPFELESNRLWQLWFWPKPEGVRGIEGTSTMSQSSIAV